MLISREYRELNKELHGRSTYGSGGIKWVKVIEALILDFNLQNVFDYGCGKGTLKKAIVGKFPLEIAKYEPAIEEKSQRPLPADLVVCTDVLEHIEPDFLEKVVQDLKGLAKQYMFLVVSTRPAKKNWPTAETRI